MRASGNWEAQPEGTYDALTAEAAALRADLAEAKRQLGEFASERVRLQRAVGDARQQALAEGRRDREALVETLREARDGLQEAHEYGCEWPIGLDTDAQEQRGGPRDTFLRNMAYYLVRIDRALAVPSVDAEQVRRAAQLANEQGVSVQAALPLIVNADARRVPSVDATAVGRPFRFEDDEMYCDGSRECKALEHVEGCFSLRVPAVDATAEADASADEAMTEAEWNRQYDEAMQWRDWQTCDYLLTIRPAAVAASGQDGETTT